MYRSNTADIVECMLQYSMYAHTHIFVLSIKTVLYNSLLLVVFLPESGDQSKVGY